MRRPRILLADALETLARWVRPAPVQLPEPLQLQYALHVTLMHQAQDAGVVGMEEMRARLRADLQAQGWQV